MSVQKRTMQLKEAAEMYSVSIHTLRDMCAKGELGNKVGQVWYVTPQAMDNIFIGDESGNHKAKRVSRKSIKLIDKGL